MKMAARDSARVRELRDLHETSLFDAVRMERRERRLALLAFIERDVANRAYNTPMVSIVELLKDLIE